MYTERKYIGQWNYDTYYLDDKKVNVEKGNFSEGEWMYSTENSYKVDTETGLLSLNEYTELPDGNILLITANSVGGEKEVIITKEEFIKYA